MGRFVLGLVVGICLVFGGAYYYFASGMAPAAATAQPMPFETMMAKKALHARLAKEAPRTVPLQPTADNLMAGAQIYKDRCAFCHSLPNSQKSVEGTGMFPHAPQLWTKDGMVTDDPPGVTYWKVKNGIRLTGMPSFEQALTDQQMWQVSLLLHEADKLPPQVTAVLAPAATAAAAPATPESKKH